MRRIFILSMIAALALAMGMGGGTALAQENETDADQDEGVMDQIRGLLEDEPDDDRDDEQEENETDSEDEPSNLHSIIDRTDAQNATDQQVEVVQEWATDEQLEDLTDDELEELESWLAAAPEPDDGPDEFVRAIDSETHITDWEFENGSFRVHIHAVEETTVTMAESADWEEGSGEYRTMTKDLTEGNNTIHVDTFAGKSDGVALSFATPLSMEEERGPYISTGTEGSSEDDPFRHFGGHSGLFSGVFMTTGLAGLGAFIVVRGEESGVVEA